MNMTKNSTFFSPMQLFKAPQWWSNPRTHTLHVEQCVAAGGRHNISGSGNVLARRVVPQLPSLRKLCLNRWGGLKEADVQHITETCSYLVELRLALLHVGATNPLVTRVEDWRLSPLVS